VEEVSAEDVSEEDVVADVVVSVVVSEVSGLVLSQATKLKQSASAKIPASNFFINNNLSFLC
jgi:hypothetical protein